MKKLLTLHNLIAVLGVVTILLFLTPCFQIRLYDSTHLMDLNLFTVTFGGSLSPTDVGYLVACGGLIASFIMAIVGICLAIARNFLKGLTLVASPLFIAAGIIQFFGEGLARSTNYNAGIGAGRSICIYGWPIAIGVIFCCLGLFALIDGVMSISKPKAKEVY